MDTQISVLIPTYNRVKSLRRAVDSVLNQTFKNYEIIIINDGGDEKNIESILNLDDRIKYFRIKHQGVGNARNYGIEKSNGKYIAFLDDDDEFITTKLETQYKFMLDNQNLIFSHTSYYLNRSDINKKSLIKSGNFTGKVFPKIIYSCPIAIPTVMINKNLFKKNNFKFHDKKYGEDVFLWIDISHKYNILGINIPLSIVNDPGHIFTEHIYKQINLFKDTLQYIKKFNLNYTYKLKLYSKIYLEKFKLNYNKKKYIHSFINCALVFVFDPLNIENFQIIIQYIKKSNGKSE